MTRLTKDQILDNLDTHRKEILNMRKRLESIKVRKHGESPYSKADADRVVIANLNALQELEKIRIDLIAHQEMIPTMVDDARARKAIIRTGNLKTSVQSGMDRMISEVYKDIAEKYEELIFEINAFIQNLPDERGESVYVTTSVRMEQMKIVSRIEEVLSNLSQYVSKDNKSREQQWRRELTSMKGFAIQQAKAEERDRIKSDVSFSQTSLINEQKQEIARLNAEVVELKRELEQLKTKNTLR